MAIRLSIGAGRARLIGELLTESLLLAVLGGIAGLIVAHWTLVLVTSLLPPAVQQTIRFSISGTVILFGIGLTFATGLLFGLFPALHSTRPDLVSTLKNQAGQPSGAKGATRLRLLLATSQIALAMMLLASSGFFVKSLLNVGRVDLGFKVDHVATFGLSPDLNGYSFDRTRLFFMRLEDELRAAPGMTAVTVSNVPLLAGRNRQRDVAVQGFKAGPDTDSNSHYNRVGPGYFSALGIPLIAGREFTDADTVNSAKVAVVNQTFAKKFGLGSDAVGKLMGSGDGYRSKLDMTIVGIVEDAKYSEVKQKVPPQFFMPYRQDKELGGMHVYVRMSGDDDARGSARGPRRRARRRNSGAVDSVSDDRCRSGGAGAFGRCARAGRAMRRLHPRAPCVTSGSDEGVEIRIACRDRVHIGPKSLGCAASGDSNGLHAASDPAGDSAGVLQRRPTDTFRLQRFPHGKQCLGTGLPGVRARVREPVHTR
jgi:predicted permease